MKLLIVIKTCQQLLNVSINLVLCLAFFRPLFYKVVIVCITNDRVKLVWEPGRVQGVRLVLFRSSTRWLGHAIAMIIMTRNLNHNGYVSLALNALNCLQYLSISEAKSCWERIAKCSTASTATFLHSWMYTYAVNLSQRSLALRECPRSCMLGSFCWN